MPPRAAAPEGELTLMVRRTIAAPVARVFAAWTEPERLQSWWGPVGVRCPIAEIDLRAGGSYRMANLLPDGNTLWISGEFLEVVPPHKLVYTWSLDDPDGPAEHTRVTVRFESRETQTEVIVLHELFTSSASRDHHERGWQGCLDCLDALLTQ